MRIVRWQARRFPRSPSKMWFVMGVCALVVVTIIAATLLRVAPALANTLANTQSKASFPAMIQHGPANSVAVVTTYKDDTFRTGQNTQEYALTTKNVNEGQFGKRVTYPVDGQVYAEPLFMPDLIIQGQGHNVVFVATEHDSVYAFDADQDKAVAPLWHTSFLSSGVTPAPSADVYTINCCNVSPEIGVTGTPVIDRATNTLYVVAMTKEPGPTYVQRLHALDITTGQERPGSPVTIKASVPGTGDGSNNGVVAFSAMHEFQRAALLLMNGVVYIPWASYGDSKPYHGWIIGYDGATLKQTAVFNDTANGSDGGIWMAGGGLAADPANGSIYFQTGNGTYDTNTGVFEGGDSIYRLGGKLQIQDTFTPFNQSCMNSTDFDLGSGGTLLLPTQPGPNPSELIGGGKEGRVYVVDRTHLGGYTSISNPCSNQNLTNVDKVIQELHPGTVVGGVFSSPAYWQGPSGAWVFESGAADKIKAFPITNGQLASTPSSKSPELMPNPGANVMISSNGSTAGSGILWALVHPGVLYAYDATNLGNELYNSNQNAARDGISGFLHFIVPTVANGEVFVGTKTSLVIFGELGYNNIGISDDSAPGSGSFDGGGSSYSEQALTSVGMAPGQTVTFNGVSFVWPNVAAGVSDNYLCQGQTITATPPSGATTLAFLGSSSNGPSTGSGTITYTDGTTQAYTLTLTDWTLDGGTAPPSAGNSVVTTMTYRNTPSGKQTRTVDVFSVEFALASGKTVASVTLPSSTDKGQLHVFALGFK